MRVYAMAEEWSEAIDVDDLEYSVFWSCAKWNNERNKSARFC